MATRGELIRSGRSSDFTFVDNNDNNALKEERRLPLSTMLFELIPINVINRIRIATNNRNDDEQQQQQRRPVLISGRVVRRSLGGGFYATYVLPTGQPKHVEIDPDDGQTLRFG